MLQPPSSLTGCITACPAARPPFGVRLHNFPELLVPGCGSEWLWSGFRQSRAAATGQAGRATRGCEIGLGSPGSEARHGPITTSAASHGAICEIRLLLDVSIASDVLHPFTNASRRHAALRLSATPRSSGCGCGTRPRFNSLVFWCAELNCPKRS